MFIFRNDQFPVIYTASKADIAADASVKDRYPIVHAIICNHEFNGDRKLGIRFDVIGDHKDTKIIEYKRELVKRIIEEYKIKGLVFEMTDKKFYNFLNVDNKIAVIPYKP